MAARSIILVPPFLKYSAGPLLGPSLLNSAACMHGHNCSVLDLNAMYIRPRASKRLATGNFIGDHDKPTGPRSLGLVEEEFLDYHILPALKRAPSFVDTNDVMQKIRFAFLANQNIEEASAILAEGQFGLWVKNAMTKQVNEPPGVVGVSLLHAGQVIPSAAISNVARQLWPQALIVWGGPHIAGLGKQTIEDDIRTRSFAADVFVTGHAEETFVTILSEAAVLKRITSKCPIVLEGKSSVISPTFDDLDLYDAPLTLPAQSSIGCSYGRCSYCTYPSIGGGLGSWILDPLFRLLLSKLKKYLDQQYP